VLLFVVDRPHGKVICLAAGVLLDEVASLNGLDRDFTAIPKYTSGPYVSSDEIKARNAMITLMFVLINNNREKVWSLGKVRVSAAPRFQRARRT
jgi:hypothetical protein